MTITIAVCTCNRAESLQKTLESIGLVRVPDTSSCELIIVDNASTDGTADVVRGCTLPNMRVRYAYEPRTGQCFARNTALGLATGDIILFTDDDVRPPPNWIEGMCKPILAGKAQAVAGGVGIAAHLERPWMQRQHREWFFASTAHRSYADRCDGAPLMVGANMAFLREVLAKVPAFDPELGPGASGLWDEVLFTWQLNEAGYAVGSAFDVVAEHHFNESRLSRASLLETAEKQGRGAAYVQHHWAHEAIRFPRWMLAKRRVRLAVSRFLNWRSVRQPEGLATWEAWLVYDIARCKQHLVERKRPRNYEKRGLTKLPRVDSPVIVSPSRHMHTQCLDRE